MNARQILGVCILLAVGMAFFLLERTEARPGEGNIVEFPPGVYHLATPIILTSGVRYRAEPGAIIQNDTGTYALQGVGVSSTTVEGFTIQGGPGISIQGGSGDIIRNNTVIDSTADGFATSAGIWLLGLDHAVVDGNTVRNVAGVGIGFYNLDNSTISHNTLSDIGEGISGDFDDTRLHRGDVVDSNTVANAGRMGIEIIESVQPGEATPVVGLRVTNNITGRVALRGSTQGGAYVDIGISVVPCADQAGGDSGTVVSGNHTQGSGWGIEVCAPHGLVEHNILANHTTGIIIACSPGMRVSGNVMVGVATPFLQDGGYCGGEVVGTNTVNGVATVGSGW